MFEKMDRSAADANKYGFDGLLLHESSTIEKVKGAFDGLRKAHDAMSR